MPVDIIINFRSSSRKSQSQKNHSFHNTVLLKKPHSFYEPQLTLNLSEFTVFPGNVFMFGVQKKKLHHFLKPKNCILEAKQMFVCFCISPWENFCSIDVVRFYLVGWFGERLNYLFKATGCLGLVKCFTFFKFNWNFWKFNYFLVFWYFYLYHWNNEIFQTIWTLRVRSYLNFS